MSSYRKIKWKGIRGSTGGLFAPRSYREFFVDDINGNDANPGTSRAQAWQTIDPKVNGETFRPTDHIFLIRDGEWREMLTPPSSGIAGKPIVFGAYGSGARPIINGAEIITGWAADGGSYVAAVATEPTVVFYDGSRLTENNGATNTVGASEWDWNANSLWVNVGEDPDIGTLEADQRNRCILSGQDWLIFENLHLRYSERGIRVSGAAEHNIIRDCTVDRCGLFGVNAEGDYTKVLNCIINDVASGTDLTEGIAFGNCDNGQIIGNTISNVHDGMRGLAGSAGSVVRGNIVFNCTDDGIDFFGAGVDNNIVEKNLVYDCADDGIKVHGGAASNIVRNNIVYQCGSSAYYFSGLNNVWYHNVADDCIVHFRMSVGDPCSVIMKNNISYDTGWRHIDHDVGVAATIDNNRYFPDDDFQYDDILYNTFAAYEAASGQDANSVMEDPLLVNAGAHNYHLLVGSPCRGAGAVGTGVTDDYDGVTRGSPPDIGAYEYVP